MNMDLFEQISNDIKEAMKAKDKVRLETLRNVKKCFLEAKTAPGANDTLTDDAALKIMQKLVKQGKDSASVYEGQGRADLAEEEMAQVRVIEAYLPKPPQDILDALLQEGQGDDKGGVIHIDSDGTITRQQLSNLQPDILSVFSGNATSPYMRTPSRISFTCSTSSNTVIDNVLECTFSVPDVSFPSGPMLLYFHDYVVADSEWHNIIATCDFGFTDMIINNYALGDPSNTEGLITDDYEAQVQFLYAGVQEMTSPTNWSIRIPTNISPSSRFTR